MQISEENINNLKPFPNNPRQHTDKQVQQIASSIAEFGFLNPILVDEKNGLQENRNYCSYYNSSNIKFWNWH